MAQSDMTQNHPPQNQPLQSLKASRKLLAVAETALLQLTKSPDEKLDGLIHLVAEIRGRIDSAEETLRAQLPQADELKTELDAARDQASRLAEENDTLEETAQQLYDDLDRLAEEHEATKERAARKDDLLAVVEALLTGTDSFQPLENRCERIVNMINEHWASSSEEADPTFAAVFSRLQALEQVEEATRDVVSAEMPAHTMDRLAKAVSQYEALYQNGEPTGSEVSS